MKRYVEEKNNLDVDGVQVESQKERYELRVDIIEFLKNHNYSFKGPNSRGYISADCYSCEGKRKLQISIEDDEKLGIKKGRTKCWSCGANSIVLFYSRVSGLSETDSRRALFRKIGESTAQEEISLIEVKNVDVQSIRHAEFSINEIISKYEELPLPLFSRLLKATDTQAQSYLQKRGLLGSDIHSVSIYITDFSTPSELISLLSRHNIKLESAEFKKQLSFANRLIFPVLANGKNYGFVARDFSGVPGRIKVLNSGGPLTFAFSYNFDNVKLSEQLVINEGIFDSIKCGISRSCALLSKSPVESSDKIKLLSRLNPDEVIVYLDNGAYADAVKICGYFSKKFKTRIVVTKPELNKVPSQELYTLLQKFIPVYIEEGQYLIAPRNLKLAQDLSDCISSPDFISEFKRKSKFERYKNDQEMGKKLENLIDRFKKMTSAHRSSFAKVLIEVKKIDYRDAGDRTYAENDKLIQEAFDFNPNFDYEFIERSYEF